MKEEIEKNSRQNKLLIGGPRHQAVAFFFKIKERVPALIIRSQANDYSQNSYKSS